MPTGGAGGIELVGLLSLRIYQLRRLGFWGFFGRFRVWRFRVEGSGVLGGVQAPRRNLGYQMWDKDAS